MNFADNCLVDSLVSDINLECLNPTSQNTYQPADIARLMDCEMSLGIVPLLKAVRQEYFVYNVDVDIVAGKTAYTFPPRAIGNAMRDIVLLDASGNEVALNQLMREYIKVQFPFNFVPSIWSFGQYMSGNEVNLYNTLIQSYTAYKLRFITERRPNSLVLSANCGKISAITGNILTLSYVDPTWTTSDVFDVINPLPPFQSIVDDLTISLINGFQVTVSSVAGLAKGQWFCPAGLACIPQIPYELFPLLKSMTVQTIAEALDMSQLASSTAKKVEEYKSNALTLARPRVAGSPKVIINRDNFGASGMTRGNTWR